MKTDPTPAQAARCSRCGSEMLLDAAGKLCSACLLESALTGFNETGAIADATASSNTTKLGDYELLEEIARGGMGVVYRARQRGLGRIVALKLILVGRWASASQVRRFEAEATAAARLDHPNIVPIFEIGETDGQHFFSMKLIEGRSLACDLQTNSRWAPPEAARFLIRVARAVHYAHQRGVLHRDLKPANILLDAAGEPHLTDFGLAKVFQEDASTTLSAELVGTPAYMAPEQAGGKGAHVTVAADVYSLGAILYELLTGVTPFTGASPLEILELARQRAPESLCRRNPSVPPDLEVICLKCLNPDPGRRYHSAESLADDLERWLNGRPILARPVPPIERLWLWAGRKPAIATLSAALILLVAATGIVSVNMAWRIRQERDRATALAAANHQQLVELNLGNGLRSIAQGEHFDALPWLVETLRLNTNNPHRERSARVQLAALYRELPQLEQVWFHELPVADAAFSPDESLVATAAGNQVFVWVAASGRPAFPPLEHPLIFADVERRLQGTTVSQLGFSPDGSVLVSVCGAYAQLWKAKTGEKIGAPLTHDFRINHFLFSPEGREVLTAGEDGKIKRWSVETGAASGSPLRIGSPVYRLALAPQPALLAIASVEQATRLWRTDTWNAIGTPMAHSWTVLDVCFSPDSTRVATAGGDNRARLWDANSGVPQGRVFWHKDEVHRVAFSPDGKQLLTGSRDHTAKIWRLVDDVDDPFVLRHNGPVRETVFSPDGRWVATASADGRARIWDAADGRLVMSPMPHNGEVVTAAFRRDGRALLTGSADGTARIWRLPVTTTSHWLFRDSWWFIKPPSLSATSRWAVMMDNEGLAFIWDLSLERCISPVLRHPKPVFLGAISDDGQLAVTASHDEKVRIWEVSSGREWGEAIPFIARHLLLVSPDNQFIAMADSLGVIRVWDMEKRLFHPELNAPGLPLVCAAFSTDSQRLVVGARDQTVRVYDLAAGQETARYSNNAPVVAVRFSSDGKRVAAGDESGQVIVWNAADATVVTTMKQARRINSLAFSGDGQRLLTGAEDGTARLWDVAHGRALLRPFQHAWPVRSVAFSPDGLQAVTVDARLGPQFWELHLGHPVTPPRLYHLQPVTNSPSLFAGPGSDWNWKLPPDERGFEMIQQEVLVLSGREVNATGDLVPVSPERLRATWESLRAMQSE